MLLDADTCYRAMASRDRRFDGQFIVGVRTTGIYCRPGCPAPLPKRENVTFFACAAAAEGAGLRPCLRCRPDASAGSPAAQGTPATVTRALRLIGEGALDGAGVEELAARLGMGARHLRRLFDRHLGASPLAIAESQRVHFARKLLEETELPMTEVAHASGFSSVRRFNGSVSATFREPPTALRRRAQGKVPGPGSADTIELCLPFRAPLDWDALLAFLAPRAIPEVECVTGGVYSRTVALGAAVGALSVRRADETHLALELRLRGRVDLLPVCARVRRLFDLDADPRAIGDALARDRRRARSFAARPGLRVPGAWDGFELAVRAILGQQITVRGATTLSGRLAARFGEPALVSAPGLSRLFPTPSRLARAELEEIGLPRARAAAIRALAEAALAGASLDGWAGVEPAIAALTALPGVGAWTAHYVAMRAGREPDAFPAGDLALRRRAARPGEELSARELEALAEKWRPFRAYAAMHLWTK